MSPPAPCGALEAASPFPTACFCPVSSPQPSPGGPSRALAGWVSLAPGLPPGSSSAVGEEGARGSGDTRRG